jgi:hypothetical protein
MDLEHALEGELEVARLHRLSVRELDALTNVERVPLAAVRRLRNLGGEIGDELGSRLAVGHLEGEQPVVHADEDLPELQRVVDRGVGRAGVRVGEQDHGPALPTG